MKTLIFFTYLINKCSIIVKTISYSFHNSLFLKFSLVPINIPFSREDMGEGGGQTFPQVCWPPLKIYILWTPLVTVNLDLGYVPESDGQAADA